MFVTKGAAATAKGLRAEKAGLSPAFAPGSARFRFLRAVYSTQVR
ncbi:hypothetical protein HMPREF7215_1709 [Pyramidobacter piscolens W5455]|uniref:Uncharacterized protein n=1 Tax=Pyramidobacter piscolens W5455 TaxID=352165 RepID=A0ABM9ZXT6_9BACT|nr:hypothetical protein HMPREF7215_1709 [Pyramidobacter piscolens W5455]